MNTSLLFIGAILLVLGFLIGVLKQTWLLSGFNEKRVSNKDKLSKLVGGYSIIMGFVFLMCGFFSVQTPDILFVILVIGFISLILYSNLKLVDK